MSKISSFPIMFYAVITGLGGLSVAYMRLNDVLKINDSINAILAGLTSVIFVIITLFYLVKIIMYPKDVAAELNHPIKINFFAAFAI